MSLTEARQGVLTLEQGTENMDYSETQKEPILNNFQQKLSVHFNLRTISPGCTLISAALDWRVLYQMHRSHDECVRV